MSIPWDNLNDQALAQLMEAYLLGTLTDEQVDLFETSLLHNPEAADLCAQAIETVAMTREVFRDHQEQRAVLDRDETLQGFHELLAELGAAEDRAETQLVHLVGHVKTRQPLWQQWQFVIPSAIAALLAIAVILIVALPANTPIRTSPGVAQTPDPSSAPAATTAQAVATLTATHNAQWAQPSTERALARGSALKAGDRLTLTAGFAEITTHDGAIAILEAPATVELLGNNNALRLHTGKLVGICETDSSKGFLVRTPHLDVTDLGTRFGVDATFTSTEVHVFQGEVRAALLSNHAEASLVQQLTAGQAVVSTNSKMTLVNLETGSFVPALNFASGLADLCPRFEGDPVIWRGELAQDMDLRVQESDKTQLMLEHRGLLLDAGVPVDLLPGEVWPHERGFGKALAHAGSKVDVYLLHFDPVGSKSSLDIETTSVLRFDRPIVGLIGAQSTLHSTDSHLGLPGVTYPRPINVPASPPGGPAGLDLEPNLDVVKVSEDGLTLTLKLQTGHLTDQIRILVQANLNPPLEKP